MKKILALILCVLTVLPLFSCAAEENKTAPATNETVETAEKTGRQILILPAGFAVLHIALAGDVKYAAGGDTECWNHRKSHETEGHKGIDFPIDS